MSKYYHTKQPGRRIAGRWLAAVAAVVALTGGALSQFGAHAAGALAVDGSVSAHQASNTTSISTAALSTTQSNDLLLAFINLDGPSGSAQSVSSVSGGNLTWKLVKRANAQAGTAEIWTAVAASPLKSVTFKASHSGSYQGTLTVTAFSGAKTTVGASNAASARTGAPTISLTTTSSGSWTWGTGMDWDAAVNRTIGSGQTMVDQFINASSGSFWTQRQTSPSTSPAGSVVTLNDTAPTADRWNMAAVEVVPLVSDSTPPSVPTGLTATPATSANRVDLSWTASTDNIGVTGYSVWRNGSQIGTTAGTSFSDSTVTPSTSYSYTVRASDAAGNTSADSTAAVVTTNADTTAPVVSAVNATNVQSAAATISWTTDEAANSQVEYGLDTTYGSSTTLDSTLVTSHSQGLSGLTPQTVYHYHVKSADAAGNLATSPDATFTTAPVATGNPAPGISKGVIIDNNPTIAQDAIDAQNAGVTWVRGWLECGNGAATASMAQTLQQRGMTFLPTYNCPLTVSVADYQTKLAADMAALAPYGVHTWEIGNEMNGGWNAEDNYCNNNQTNDMVCAEKAYLEYLKGAYQTIHAGDPQGIVVYGGLTDWNVTFDPWMKAMLADGQAWNYMDGIGFHPYGGTITNSMAGMNSLKNYMSQNATLATKPIWITEVGCWSSGLGSGQQSPCSPQTEAGKSAYLTGLYDNLKAWNKGTSFEIRTPICWYILHESGNTPGYGLVQLTSPRTYLPAYTAMKNYVF